MRGGRGPRAGWLPLDAPLLDVHQPRRAVLGVLGLGPPELGPARARRRGETEWAQRVQHRGRELAPPSPPPPLPLSLLLSHLSFMMSPSTDAPKNTMCLRRGGSSTLSLNFCSRRSMGGAGEDRERCGSQAGEVELAPEEQATLAFPSLPLAAPAPPRENAPPAAPCRRAGCRAGTARAGRAPGATTAPAAWSCRPTARWTGTAGCACQCPPPAKRARACVCVKCEREGGATGGGSECVSMNSTRFRHRPRQHSALHCPFLLTWIRSNTMSPSPGPSTSTRCGLKSASGASKLQTST
jgi:hypothetical protein